MSKRKKMSEKMPKEKDALGYLRKVQNKFQGEPLVYNQFLDIMKDFKSKAIKTEGVIERVKTLFHGNDALILGFNQFLPPGYKIELDQMEERKAVQYVVKIKHRFRDQPEIYQEFLDILHVYQAKRTVDEVYQRVQTLFGNEPDLLEEFRHFLPETQSLPRPKKKHKKNHHTMDMGKKYREPTTGRGYSSGKYYRGYNDDYPLGTDLELAFFEKMKSHLAPSTYTQFMQVLDMFTRKIISRPELMRVAADLLPRADYVERFKHAIQYDEWEERRFVANRTHYYSFIQSVDYTTCKQISPSYRQLPSSIIVPPCSGRTVLDQENLNDTAISITAGSEDFSFKATRKNTYEEALFKAEDERFELDMLIENNAQAIAVLQPTADLLKDMPSEQAKRVCVKNLDILHIRAISKLYGASALEIVTHLNNNPAAAVPVVLKRLKQKDKEWRQVKADMRTHWRRIGEANYQRSLDHRSFYFKQEDKKRRTAKVLIQELRDLQQRAFGAERTQEELEDEINNTALAALKAKSGSPIYSYALRFEYKAPQIHKLLYEIVVRTARRLVAEDQVQRIAHFLEYFVHHVLDVRLEGRNTLIPLDAARVTLAETMVPQFFEGKATQVEGDDAMRSTTEAKHELDAFAAAAAAEDEQDPEKDVSALLAMGSFADAQETLSPSPAAAAKATRSEDEVLDSLPAIYAGLQNSRSSTPKAPVKKKKGQPAAPAKQKSSVPSLDAFATLEAAAPMREHQRPSRLFFANAPFYVLFRLHRFLFERLLLAQTLSHKERQTRNQDLPPAGDHRYVEFLGLLEGLLNGGKEPSKFEDACRTLLGSASYTLFTIEKLVACLVKHIISLLNSPLCIGIMEVYLSEFLKSRASGDVAPSLAVSKSRAHAYHERVSLLISQREGSDEVSLSQMEFFDDTRDLCFSMVDMLVVPGHSDQKGVFLESTPNWQAWTEQHVSGGPVPQAIADRVKQPYLQRNLLPSAPEPRARSNELQSFLGPNRTQTGVQLWYAHPTEDVYVSGRPQKVGNTRIVTSNAVMNTSEEEEHKAIERNILPFYKAKATVFNTRHSNSLPPTRSKQKK